MKLDPPGPGDRGQPRERPPDLLVAAALAGTGVIYTFEEWLRPHFETGALEPLLQRWWLRFSGPFLY